MSKIRPTYRTTKFYERLSNEAFNLVRKQILNDLRENQHLGHLGIEPDNLEIEKYFYLINYLIHVRQQIDRYLAINNISCLNDAQIDTINEKFLLPCILRERVCNKYTNNLIDFIINIPNCKDALKYEWTGLGVCTLVEGEAYLERVNLIERRSNFVTQIFEIPTNIDLETFQAFVPTATSELLQARYLIDSVEECCLISIPQAPFISIDLVTTNSATISWSGSDNYRIQLFQGETELLNEITTEPTRTFSNLLLSTEYRIVVSSFNCAGESQAVRNFQTLPYILTLSTCLLLENQIIFENISLGTNEFTEHEGTLVFRFTDLFAPYFTVNSVLVNGVDYSNGIIYDTFIEGQPIGGSISIFGISQDLEIELCGVAVDSCSLVDTTFDDITDTIIIN